MNEAPVETPGPFSWAKYRLNRLNGLESTFLQLDSGPSPDGRRWRVSAG